MDGDWLVGILFVVDINLQFVLTGDNRWTHRVPSYDSELIRYALDAHDIVDGFPS